MYDNVVCMYSKGKCDFIKCIVGNGAYIPLKMYYPINHEFDEHDTCAHSKLND